MSQRYVRGGIPAVCGKGRGMRRVAPGKETGCPGGEAVGMSEGLGPGRHIPGLGGPCPPRWGERKVYYAFYEHLSSPCLPGSTASARRHPAPSR